MNNQPSAPTNLSPSLQPLSPTPTPQQPTSTPQQPSTMPPLSQTPTSQPQTPTPQPQQPTPTLSAPISTDSSATTVTEPVLSPSEQRQRAIIGYFVPKIKELLVDEPISLHNLEKNPDFPSFRRFFLQDLRTDKITIADEITFLETIPSNYDTLGARQIFDLISRDTYTKQILAVVTGHNSTNWQDTVAGDIDTFLAPPARNQTDYRTPVGFAELRRRFLSEISASAAPNQLDAYIKAMNTFEEHLYGERFDYYRDFETLRKEASTLGQGADAASLANATSPNPDNLPDRPDDHVVGRDLPTARFTAVSDEHREQLLSHALIEGDLWRQNGQDYRLSVPNLVSAGLVPKYEVSIGSQTIYLTNLFTLTNGQMAAIGFLPTNYGYKARSFYRDKNSALWRYLPDYIRNLNGEGIETFGTGFDEKSVTLPITLQFTLNQIERQRNILDLSNTNPDFLFAGTAHAYATRQDFRDALTKGQLKGDFYDEVSATALNAEAANLLGPNRRKNAPQLISVNANLYPNFAQSIARYSVYSALTGQTLGEGFWSNDRQTAWLFFSDYRGRSWVANQETTAPVTSTGCRKEWLLPTDVATPLYEATLLADGYGDTNDTRSGNLICMWNNYLSKIPLIQEYTRTLNK